MEAAGHSDQELRDRALERLKKRRDFKTHVVMYVLVNAFLVVIWAVTTAPDFFWPIFPIVGWGSPSQPTHGTCTGARRSPRRRSAGSKSACAAARWSSR